MKWIRLLGLALCCFPLLFGSMACGSRNSGNVIYCMGDSLTYGYLDSYNRYETTLLSLLGGPPWEVHNKGVNGNTSAQMLARYRTDVLSQSPDWIVVWGGINDIGQGDSANDIKSNLQSMYTQGHDIGAKVIAINISEYGSATAAQQAEIRDVNHWIAHHAKDVDFRVDAYSRLEDPSNPNHLLPAYDSGDHLHLSDAGYDTVASGVYRVIKHKDGLPVWVWTLVAIASAVVLGLLAYAVGGRVAKRSRSRKSSQSTGRSRRKKNKKNRR